MPKIGVYVCHCGLNIAGVVDVAKVVEYAKSLPDVVVAKNYTYMCSQPGQRMIQEDIKTQGLNRIVIATCSPRMHEETFRRAVAEARLNPYLLEIVNLREHVSWAHSDEPEKATEKAKDLVRMGVARARLLEPLEKMKVSVEKSVLVVGGGIAGIQSALDMADAGLRVYLVEKTPSIGGRMAQLDKTFPTLDCSACILTPKMVDVAKHPNIVLLTNSEVTFVKGFVGNYEVIIVKKPRYVDEKACVGCELCTKVCPVKIPDEFNEGLSETRAIQIYSPYAVPKVAIINPKHCLRLRFDKDVCGKCVQVCEAKAIKFDQQSETIQLKVGGIVIAVGSEVFDASEMAELGYGRCKNVISNIEFERLVNASGPTGGKIVCPSDGKTPKTVVFVQCVGSRDKRFHEYCCRVGCMATLKQAILTREHLGRDVNIYVCFNDMRAFGKGYDEFYRRARDLDINFVAGLPSDIRYDSNGALHFDVYDKGTNKLLELRPDLVVLANGLVPNKDLEKIGELFHVSRSADGFLLEAHPKLRPLESAVSGIFLAGACQGPKDIPDTVAQASGVAAKVIDLLASGEIELEPLKAVVDEDMCSGCRICESVCPFLAVEIKTEKVGDKEKLKAEVVEAMCQGCGLCVAACPTSAIKMRHYTDEQVLAQIQAACAEKKAKEGGD
ncbi:MAG: CoB--CoM heterodisulfide reductase iron-sulfur subunit A family protein [Candidatus Bathyarchaeota archaeon]|jgi:heterodisulfide reductase subunit A|nr:CoB--CoM heterodisulfide reductase iron-sulfur subunit A family protein [Candidatus Bathyarchaeota archaeon A05DMB-5]MDH7557369.1 CoB--CoM heterodisulfide reductase iron-sulfur subunit A family protein [Candidatus Bathyarchaeota archaeon]